jgi:tetratricopeptide (TPR) repeat protein
MQWIETLPTGCKRGIALQKSCRFLGRGLLERWGIVFLLCPVILLAGCAVNQQYVRQGQAYEKQKDWDSALLSYLQASQLEPERPDLYSAIGDVYMRKERWEDALAAYRQAYSRSKEYAPRLANCLRRIASEHERSGRFTDAQQAKNEAEKLEGGTGMSHALPVTTEPRTARSEPLGSGPMAGNEGLVAEAQRLADTGDHQAALAVWKRLAAQRPENQDYLNALAQTYMKTNQIDAAMDTYKQAAAIDPKDTRTKRNWGMAYYQTGQYYQARQIWEEALSLEPADPQAKQYLGWLREIGY